MHITPHLNELIDAIARLLYTVINSFIFIDHIEASRKFENTAEEDTDLDTETITVSEDDHEANDLNLDFKYGFDFVSPNEEESETLKCEYCKVDQLAADCQVCECGQVCCCFCFKSVDKCGYLCSYTCADCCDLGVYCHRQGLLQCKVCSSDHHSRCGCECGDYGQKYDQEYEDNEVVRECTYCKEEKHIQNMVQCTGCEGLACSTCYQSNIFKCGGEYCNFTCGDCCTGVYCYRQNYAQCLDCADHHQELCGCTEQEAPIPCESSVSTDNAEDDESQDSFALDTYEQDYAGSRASCDTSDSGSTEYSSDEENSDEGENSSDMEIEFLI